MDRRTLLTLAGGIVLTAIGCAARDADEETTSDALETAPTDGGADADADAGAMVVLYDTFAQALYLDGTYGPKTGTIRAVDMGAGVDKLYEFWHGHNGVQHRFTVTAAHFAQLRKKKRVSITTTKVDDHQHTLFIDPVDLRWRVPGAQPVTVPV